LIPPGNFTIILTPGPGTQLKTLDLSIIGTAKTTGSKKIEGLSLNINPEQPWINTSIHPKKLVIVNTTETAVIQLRISPMAGFFGMVNVSIMGIEEPVTWNRDQFPITIKKQKTVELKINGLETTDKYDLTIIISSENQSTQHDLQLHVVEKSEPDGDNDMSGLIFQILILIVVLFIIIIILSKLIHHPSRSKKVLLKEPKKEPKTGSKKEPENVSKGTPGKEESVEIEEKEKWDISNRNSARSKKKR
jgi:hypothetical protein